MQSFATKQLWLKSSRGTVLSCLMMSFLAAGNVDPVLNLHLTVSEDPGERYVNACLELNQLPPGGLECETTVYLESQSDTARTFGTSY